MKALQFHWLCVLFCLVGLGWAQDTAKLNQMNRDAWTHANQVAIRGPQKVLLGDQAEMQLPAGFLFVPKAEAQELMVTWGNGEQPALLGLILPEVGEWALSIDFSSEGYVEDEEALEWDVEDLFESLKEGTEAQNEEREAMGIVPFDLVGWIQKPVYDSNLKQLRYSLAIRDKGASPDQDGANVNTYVLGREGYLNFNLMTDAHSAPEQMALIDGLLNSTTYVSGKKYEEFNASTDRVAEYGLSALVVGVAAKKLGLFAMLGLLLAKFWKLILIAFVGLGAAWRKMTASKSKSDQFDQL